MKNTIKTFLLPLSLIAVVGLSFILLSIFEPRVSQLDKKLLESNCASYGKIHDIQTYTKDLKCFDNSVKDSPRNITKTVMEISE